MLRIGWSTLVALVLVCGGGIGVVRAQQQAVNCTVPGTFVCATPGGFVNLNRTLSNTTCHSSVPQNVTLHVCPPILVAPPSVGCRNQTQPPLNVTVCQNVTQTVECPNNSSFSGNLTVQFCANVSVPLCPVNTTSCVFPPLLNLTSPCNVSHGGCDVLANCTERLVAVCGPCPPGYVGNGTANSCINATSPCASSPCLSGGSCVVNPLNPIAFLCVCKPGYSGSRCQTDIDECASNPCTNGAVCEDRVNGFKCKCPRRCHGSRCERRACDPNPCPTSFRCVTMRCPDDDDDDHGRDRTQEDYELESVSFGNPCRGFRCVPFFNCTGAFGCVNNGTCNGTTSRCDCTPGFFGTRCEFVNKNVDCRLFGGCRNGGTCVRRPVKPSDDDYPDGDDGYGNVYRCSCPPRTSGGLCDDADLGGGGGGSGGSGSGSGSGGWGPGAGVGGGGGLCIGAGGMYWWNDRKKKKEPPTKGDDDCRDGDDKKTKNKGDDDDDCRGDNDDKKKKPKKDKSDDDECRDDGKSHKSRSRSRSRSPPSRSCSPSPPRKPNKPTTKPTTKPKPKPSSSSSSHKVVPPTPSSAIFVPSTPGNSIITNGPLDRDGRVQSHVLSDAEKKKLAQKHPELADMLKIKKQKGAPVPAASTARRTGVSPARAAAPSAAKIGHIELDVR